MYSSFTSYCAVVLLFTVIAMELRAIGIIFKAISVCSASLPDQYSQTAASSSFSSRAMKMWRHKGSCWFVVKLEKWGQTGSCRCVVKLEVWGHTGSCWCVVKLKMWGHTGSCECGEIENIEGIINEVLKNSCILMLRLQTVFACTVP